MEAGGHALAGTDGLEGGCGFEDGRVAAGGVAEVCGGGGGGV